MRKIAVCIFCILLAVTVFAACETDDEARAVQATLVDDALDHMNEDFKAEHMTERAYGAPSGSPKEITYVIKSESDFEAAFEDFPIEVDFDEDMLVLQFFTGDALKYEDGARRFFYESVGATQEGKVLTAEVVKHKTTLLPPEETMPDASVPTQECLAFVVPRSDVEQVELKIDHKNYVEFLPCNFISQFPNSQKTKHCQCCSLSIPIWLYYPIIHQILNCRCEIKINIAFKKGVCLTMRANIGSRVVSQTSRGFFS